MSKKRKRDLNERIKAKEEASVSWNDGLLDISDSKRKVGDDYRNKIIKDENRFDLDKWKGQNLLGYALMMVREQFSYGGR